MFYVLKLIINSSLTVNKRNHCFDFSKRSLLILQKVIIKVCYDQAPKCFTLKILLHCIFFNQPLVVWI